MLAGFSAFKNSDDEQDNYNYLKRGLLDDFWEIPDFKRNECNQKPFPATFKELILGMLHPNPDHRYTIDRALAHPWLTETIKPDDTHDNESSPRLAAATQTQNELNSYFEENEFLKKMQDQKSKRKREQKAEKKQNPQKQATRSAVNDQEESSEDSFDLPLALFNEKMRTTNMLFVSAKPAEVRETILTKV